MLADHYFRSRLLRATFRAPRQRVPAFDEYFDEYLLSFRTWAGDIDMMNIIERSLPQHYFILAPISARHEMCFDVECHLSNDNEIAGENRPVRSRIMAMTSHSAIAENGISSRQADKMIKRYFTHVKLCRDTIIWLLIIAGPSPHWAACHRPRRYDVAGLLAIKRPQPRLEKLDASYGFETKWNFSFIYT